MILVLIGKCAAGKDTIASQLLMEGFKPLISHTSRPMRDGEAEGREYYFVSKEEFKQLIKDDKMLEYREYHTTVAGVPDTWFYGLSKMELDPETDYVTVVDTYGADKILKYYGKDMVKVIEIRTNDWIRKNRAIIRGSFDITEWNRRFLDDEERFSPKMTAPLIDSTVCNDGTIKDTMKQIHAVLSES